MAGHWILAKFFFCVVPSGQDWFIFPARVANHMEVCASPHIYRSWRVPGVVFPQWSEMTSETDTH